MWNIRGFNFSKVYAEELTDENSEEEAKDYSEYPIITIQADLNNEKEVEEKAQAVFNEYGKEVIIEIVDIDRNNVRDILDFSATKSNGRWVTNRRTYLLGTYGAGTEGSISCFVVEELPTSVSGCSGSVKVRGSNVVFLTKTIYKNNTLSANMTWSVKVKSDTFPYTETVMSFNVPLY